MKSYIKYSLIVICCISVFISTFLILTLRSEQTRYNEHILNGRSEIDRLNSTNEALMKSFIHGLQYNKEIGGCDIFDGYPPKIFCLYISDNMCSACVSAAFEHLNSNINLVPDSNMVVLANYNPNAIRYLKAEHQLKCRLISTDTHRFSIANNSDPCFFIYDRLKQRTEMFLFPLKKQPEMIKKYFENVNHRYFSDKVE